MGESSNCQRFQRLLEMVLDHRAEAQDAQALADHLQECPTCQSLHAAELHLREMLQSRTCTAGDVPPRQLRVRVMVSIHRQTLYRIGQLGPGDFPDGSARQM